MVDNTNPTNQFHPYTPTDATPHSERPERGVLMDVLSRAGINQESLDNVKGKLGNLDMKQSVGKARDFARNNAALTLGGLAVAAIGLGLMRRKR